MRSAAAESKEHLPPTTTDSHGVHAPSHTDWSRRRAKASVQALAVVAVCVDEVAELVLERSVAPLSAADTAPQAQNNTHAASIACSACRAISFRPVT